MENLNRAPTTFSEAVGIDIELREALDGLTPSQCRLVEAVRMGGSKASALRVAGYRGDSYSSLRSEPLQRAVHLANKKWQLDNGIDPAWKRRRLIELTDDDKQAVKALEVLNKMDGAYTRRVSLPELTHLPLIDKPGYITRLAGEGVLTLEDAERLLNLVKAEIQAGELRLVSEFASRIQSGEDVHRVVSELMPRLERLTTAEDLTQGGGKESFL